MLSMPRSHCIVGDQELGASTWKRLEGFIFLLVFLQTTTADQSFGRVAVTKVSIQSNDDDGDDDDDGNTWYLGSQPQGKKR